MKIFISYAREDLNNAIKIRESLREEGIISWIDVEDILPGQNWKVYIRQAIKDCTYFLALLSSNSVSKRGYVQKELKIALEILDEMPATEIFIIPVRLDECEPIHERLRDLQWVDLFSSYEKGIENICRVVKSFRITSSGKHRINQGVKEENREFQIQDLLSKTNLNEKDIYLKIDLSFEETIKGCLKDFTFKRTRMCQRCHGKKDLIFPCSKCNGSGHFEISEEITVNIPHGVDTGTLLRIKGKGNESNDLTEGDLYMEIHVEEHDKFTRKGNDLYTNVTIPSKIADKGGGIDFNLFNKRFELKIPKGVRSNTQLRMKGYGVKNPKGTEVGDLYFKVVIHNT